MALRLLSTLVDPPEAIEGALAPISPVPPAELAVATRAIVESVRTRGDAAIREFVREFDGVELDVLAVSPAEVNAARARIAPTALAAIEAAAAHIAAFYGAQPRGDWFSERDDARFGYIERPLDRVGIHVPAGKAPLPSTLLMAAVPARAAGVPEVIVCSAPRRDGSVDPHLLAAARVAGVDRYFRVGGAQAVAALAFGTESIPRVDKIFGAGNPYVVMAKRLVFGHVDIHSLPGPSEIVVIADQSATARWVAADLISQAEHGQDSLAILLTPSLPLARAVMDEVARQLSGLPRAEVARACLEKRGWAIVTRDLDEACALANRCAPEHVELLVADPRAWLPRIRNAGAVFLGGYSSEPMGDYVAGPSHILPTGGTARFSSPLHVSSFLKRISVIEYGESAFRRDASHAQTLARAEGLEAHARAIEVRLE
ncbi:MAG: histidinol dehydrogenase [Armatimonadetes bacterium]|nr:histidinol dehydrogenase [Armatimonadota bacterium]